MKRQRLPCRRFHSKGKSPESRCGKISGDLRARSKEAASEICSIRSFPFANRRRSATRSNTFFLRISNDLPMRCNSRRLAGVEQRQRAGNRTKEGRRKAEGRNG